MTKKDGGGHAWKEKPYYRSHSTEGSRSTLSQHDCHEQSIHPSLIQTIMLMLLILPTPKMRKMRLSCGLVTRTTIVDDDNLFMFMIIYDHLVMKI